MRPSLHMQARRIRCAATNPNPSGTTTTTTVPGHEELDKAVQDLLAAARVRGAVTRRLRPHSFLSPPVLMQACDNDARPGK
jgi:hypothetical protein